MSIKKTTRHPSEATKPGAKTTKAGNKTTPETEPLPAFPVVGVGASAGGLGAFRELLKHLPTDTGMAFILVQHLDPHHESMLVPLLSDSTTMPVHEAKDNMQVEPNSVYVIPPNTNMGILHYTLQLVRRDNTKGRHLPVDWFLRTLAEDRGTGAIGVILSGTASDGTLGMKEVKAANGITFAQDETSADYFGMPGSAIAAGCVDFVLSPKEIAREIGRIARHPYVLRERPAEDMAAADGDQLNKVFLLLRSLTGHDFTYYKHTTIKRRIKRRMLVHKLERLSDYVRFLQQNQAEVAALFQDILINVTGFFRDPEVFESLSDKVFPKLLDKRPNDAPLRIWVPGCSTGEEAYSLAITLQEQMGDGLGNIPVQIFATDIDDRAVEKARQGIYPERIVNEISSGRLKRFFVKVSGGYLVSKTIRDMCIFAEQNVTKDPPFSRLDLICCRNLLIYLGAVLQKKVLQVFHYALKPSGFLLLGTSETIGSHADLFRMVDKKNKVYAKKSVATQFSYDFQPRSFYPEEPATAAFPPESAVPPRDLYRETEQMILARYGPPGVVINREMEILHFHGETGPYLNPSPGSASLNLLKMARQELAVELRAAAHKAAKAGEPVRKEGIRIHANGNDRLVDLQIIPMSGPIEEERCLLVLFEEIEHPAGEQEASKKVALASKADQDRIQEMEQELATSREYMQSIIEEQEATNEDLKSANEEIQSTNEEMQSTNEELETAKEELQSSNEELATVNEELENRNLELVASNNDLTNLLASVNLPILMLGEDLQVRQFTPQAEKLLNLIESDLGRPMGQIRPNVEIPHLEEMVYEVIDSMIVKSIEIQDRNGRWYNLRIRPYKTLDNRIEGAVLTFIDIDEIKDVEQLRKTQANLLESKERLQAILDNSTTVIYLKDTQGRYQLINHRYEELFNVERDAVVGMTDHDLFPKAIADRLRANDLEVIRANKPLEFEETLPQSDGDHLYLSVKFPLRCADGRTNGVSGISTDITQRLLEAEELRRLATIVRDANDAITVQDFNGCILAWNPAAERIYGWSENEALAMNIYDLVAEQDRSTLQKHIQQVEHGRIVKPLEVVRITKSGANLRIRLTASLLVDEKGKPKAVATTEQQLG